MTALYGGGNALPHGIQKACRLPGEEDPPHPVVDGTAGSDPMHKPAILLQLLMDAQVMLILHICNETREIFIYPATVPDGHAQHQLPVLHVEPGVVLGQIRLQPGIEEMGVKVDAAPVVGLKRGDILRLLTHQLSLQGTRHALAVD